MQHRLVAPIEREFRTLVSRAAVVFGLALLVGTALIVNGGLAFSAPVTQAIAIALTGWLLGGFVATAWLARTAHLRFGVDGEVEVLMSVQHVRLLPAPEIEYLHLLRVVDHRDTCTLLIKAELIHVEIDGDGEQGFGGLLQIVQRNGYVVAPDNGAQRARPIAHELGHVDQVRQVVHLDCPDLLRGLHVHQAHLVIFMCDEYQPLGNIDGCDLQLR